MLNIASTSANEEDLVSTTETLTAEMDSTGLKANDFKKSDESGENRGKKRPLSEKKQKVRVLPISEKELKLLKKRASEVLGMLDEILELDFIQNIERRHFASFKAARGDVLSFINCTTAKGKNVNWPSSSQPSKKSRIAVKENRAAPMASSGKNRRQERQQLNNGTSWPRSNSNVWSKQRPAALNQQKSYRLEAHGPGNMRRWASDQQQPYLRRSSQNSFSRDIGAPSLFLRSGGYQNSALRGTASSFNTLGLGYNTLGFSEQCSNKRGSLSKLTSAGRTNSSWNGRPKANSRSRKVPSRCDLCDVEHSGPASYDQHIAGRRHKAALEARKLTSVSGS